MRYLGTDIFEFSKVNGDTIELSKEDILKLLNELDDEKREFNSPQYDLMNEAGLLRREKREIWKSRRKK